MDVSFHRTLIGLCEVLDFWSGVLLIWSYLYSCLVFVSSQHFAWKERQARAGCLHHEAQGGIWLLGHRCPLRCGSPPLVPTWTCAPQMTSPSPWMPWCTTSILTMRRWRSPTQLSCSTATSPTAVAWCALSWLWPLETTKVTRLLLACFYLLPSLLFSGSFCPLLMILNVVIHEIHWTCMITHTNRDCMSRVKRPSYKECASSGVCLMTQNGKALLTWPWGQPWSKTLLQKSIVVLVGVPTWKCVPKRNPSY